MKEIKAFIKPQRVHDVVGTLTEKGFKSVAITSGEGTGSYKNPEASPSLHFSITDSKNVKIELVCKKEHVKEAVEIIQEYGTTPEAGDGIIYVSNVEEIYNVKTGKTELDEG